MSAPLRHIRVVTSVFLALGALGCGSVVVDSSVTGGTGTGVMGTAGAGGSSSSTGLGGEGGGVVSVVELAIGVPAPWGIAVDATSLLWTSFDDGTVWRIPTGGGDPTTLADQQVGPTAIAIAGDAAWVGTAQGLARIALDGSSASVVWSTPITQAVTARAGLVYFSSGPNVCALPIVGGASQTLGLGSSFVHGIAVDATHVYWTASAGNIQSVPIGGGPVTTIASFQAAPYGIAVDGAHVYWSNRGNPPGSGAIMRAPVDGSAEPEVLAANEPGPQQMVLDGATLYWVDYGWTESGGAVRKMPVSGGVPTSVYEGLEGINALAVDAESVYWSNELEGTLQKTAK